ncbi:MAG: uracil-DNA glycosylase [Campylobacterota bacterium]
MDSYQNLALLENLYRLKALGYRYVDPLVPNFQTPANTLPDSLATLKETVGSCYLCDLSKSRRQSMSGYGSTHAQVMFVDAYVSAAEDESAEYYTGRSGAMLRDMIEKVLMLNTEEVYFTHAVKCKPFGFQQPSSSECNSCLPYLARQIEIVRPRIVVALGPDAYELVTRESEDFERVRGTTIEMGGYSVIPMYHPSFLIRNPSMKKEALRDLQTIKAYLS